MDRVDDVCSHVGFADFLMVRMMLWLRRLAVDPIVVGLAVVELDLSVDPRQTVSSSLSLLGMLLFVNTDMRLF